jgi:hypothetical protein
MLRALKGSILASLAIRRSGRQGGGEIPRMGHHQIPLKVRVVTIELWARLSSLCRC